MFDAYRPSTIGRKTAAMCGHSGPDARTAPVGKPQAAPQGAAPDEDMALVDAWLRDANDAAFERASVATIRGLLPPAKDNQRAANFLCSDIGVDHPFVQWAAVRPDTLLDGDVSEYAWHEGLVSSLFKPGRTNRANVARAMCELATDPKVWDAWKGKLPVVVNTGTLVR